MLLSPFAQIALCQKILSDDFCHFAARVDSIDVHSFVYTIFEEKNMF